MRNYDGIIFDIDGTLTSTNELIFESFRHISKKYLNKTFTNEEIIPLFGPPEDAIIKDWCGDNYEDARKDYYDFYEKNHHLADLYPGMRDILESLKKKNILLSIYTGKGIDATTITLKKLNVFNLFDLIVTGTDVTEHKPSPEGVEMFIYKFSLNRDRVLMVGDAVADIKAARNSGIKVASVIWDSYGKEKVLKMDSDFVFHTVEELAEFLNVNT